MPGMWTSEEIEQLQTSLCKQELTMRARQYQLEYTSLCNCVPSFDHFSFADWMWARLAVLTRIFGVTVEGQRTSMLVPFADMLNHRIPHDARWEYDDEINAYVLTSVHAIQAGEQVYISYGSTKANSDLFMNYGFVCNTNIYNKAQVTLSLTETDPMYTEKIKLYGFDELTAECGEADSDETAEVLSFCRLAVADSESFAELLAAHRRLIRHALKLDVRLPQVNLSNERAARQMLAGAARDSLARFPTSLSEDALLLNATVLANVQTAIRLRICEKQVLQNWSETI